MKDRNMFFPDDAIILEYILSSDNRNEGYRLLVSKYKEKLYWHIRRMVNDHDDADDVLQNTFIKVVRNIAGFQKHSTLFTWLYRIATNECLNFIQARKKKHHEHIDDVQMLESETYTYFDESKALDKLARAINILPDKQKLVFNMRYYDEMSYQAISDITDTSVGALKASYHHAVKKIEQQLISTL